MNTNKTTSYFANRLKQRREELGLTQKELGAKVGLSDAAITQYEKGRREPKRKLLFELSEALNVSIDYFFIDEHVYDNLEKMQNMLNNEINNTDQHWTTKEEIKINEINQSLSKLNYENIKKVAEFTQDTLTQQEKNKSTYSMENIDLAREYVKNLQVMHYGGTLDADKMTDEAIIEYANNMKNTLDKAFENEERKGTLNLSILDDED